MKASEGAFRKEHILGYKLPKTTIFKNSVWKHLLKVSNKGTIAMPIDFLVVPLSLILSRYLFTVCQTGKNILQTAKVSKI